MPNINLLPWREQYRAQQKQQFLWVLGSVVVLSFGLTCLLHMTIAGQIKNQHQANLYLEKEIQQLNKKTDEIKQLKKSQEKLLNKIKIIKSLQTSRPLTVHVFDELPKVLPQGVYLTAIVREKNTLTLTGRAESNTRVSQLMRHIDVSSWLAQAILLEIKTSKIDKDKFSEFKLQMLQKLPNRAMALTRRENPHEF